MDKAIEVFLSWQAILLCLFVYGLTFSLRNAFEGGFPSLVTMRWWSKVLVPLLPLLLGPCLALIPGFPWPEALGTGHGAHSLFGFVCGLFSAQVYARYKDMAKL